MSAFFKSLGRKLRLPFNRRYAFGRLAEYHAHARTLPEVVDWAMNFGGDGYLRIKTLQIPSEITALAEKVAASKPRRILEIGTASGGTLIIWSYLAKERVITCDLKDMSYAASLYEGLVPPDSFLFIDGDHTEQGVTQDYLDYKEFVRPGGLIGFHDILENQPLETNQVFHLWKRLTPLAETEEFVNDPNQCGFGIGVLHVGPNGAPDLK